MLHLKRFLLFGSLLATLLCSVVRAEESKPKPDPTIEQLRAEVESLKNQLARLHTSMAFEMQVCNGAVQAARQFVQGGPGPAPVPSTNPSTPSPRAPRPEPTAQNR